MLHYFGMTPKSEQNSLENEDFEMKKLGGKKIITKIKVKLIRNKIFEFRLKFKTLHQKKKILLVLIEK